MERVGQQFAQRPFDDPVCAEVDHGQVETEVRETPPAAAPTPPSPDRDARVTVIKPVAGAPNVTVVTAKGTTTASAPVAATTGASAVPKP